MERADEEARGAEVAATLAVASVGQDARLTIPIRRDAEGRLGISVYQAGESP